MRIPDSVIDQINLKLSAVDVIGEHITLQAKGGKHWGLCPFHHEKTPSFSVDGEKNLFYCFGCHKGGSMISFLMEHENITFHDAVEKLADRAGVTIPRGSLEDSKEQQELRDLYALYDKLTVAFQYILNNTPEGKKALEYLKSRGISDYSIQQFALGYAPADISWLHSFLKKKGYSQKFLQKSGLFSQRNDTYPLFAGRIIFPVRDTRKRIIGFGGRDLTGREKAPKYINSPESGIYKKRIHLYGLDQATQWMRKEGRGVLCEGNFDVIALHQAGIEGAIAPLGTALTEGQVQVLKRYTSEMIIFFDSDSAGLQATLKAIELLESKDITSYVVQNPEGKDPADLLLQSGPEAVQELVGNPMGGIEFAIQQLQSVQEIESPRGKERFVQMIKPYILAVPSEIRRVTHWEQVASLLGVQIQTVLEDVKRGDSRKKGSISQRSLPPEREFSSDPFAPMDDPYQGEADSWGSGNASTQGVSSRGRPSGATAGGAYGREKKNHERVLLFAVTANPEHFAYLRSRIGVDDLQDPWAKTLYLALEECFRIGETSLDMILNHIENKEIHRYILSAVHSDRFSLNPKEYVRQAADTVILQHLEQKERRVISSIEQASAKGDTKAEESLLIEKMYIDEEKKRLKNQRMVHSEE